MPETKRLSIFVAEHAARRAGERFPGWRPDRRQRVDAIIWEVARAVEAGRRSKTLPRWGAIERRPKAGGSKRETGTFWFVWNEEETHAYLIRPGRASRGGGDLVVVSAFGRREDA